MKPVFGLILAGALVVSNVQAEEEKQQKPTLPKGSEIVAELSGVGGALTTVPGKNGKVLLVRVKAEKLSEDQIKQIQQQQKDGDRSQEPDQKDEETRANRSVINPGGFHGRVYLTTLPHLLQARALAACRAYAVGYQWAVVEGVAGHWHCYGVGYVQPLPPPVPWPVWP